MVRKQCVRRWWPYLLVLLLGLFAHGPTLRVPFAVDDYAHEAMLDRAWPLSRAPWDLYNFVDGSPAEVRTLVDAGALPWWSHPELTFKFLRPVTSLSRALDHALFHGSALGAHAHSMLWWIAACVAAALLFRRTLGDRAAPWALAFFALDASHTLPLGWLANRSFLVSTAFGLFALERFHCYREAGARRDGLLSAALFALALFSGEFALCTMAYAIAHSALSREGPVSRAKSALIWALPLLVYVAVYRLGRYGSLHSDAYLDPLRRTAAFAREAPSRWLGHMGELWFGVPTEGPAPLRWPSWVARSLGISLSIALSALLWTLRPLPRALGAMMAGCALAIVPVLPSFGATRLQMGAQVGVAAALAVLLERALDGLSQRDDRPRRIRAILAMIPAALFAIGHLLVSPYYAFHYARNMREGHLRELAMIERARVRREGIERARVVLIAAVDGQTLLYPPWIWRRAGIAVPRAFLGLTATSGLYRLRRPERDSLVLEAFSGGYLLDQPEMMFRARESALREGERVEWTHFSATIEQRRRVRRVRFRFRESIERDFRLMVMDEQGLHEIPLPPLGGAIVVPAAQVAAR